MSDITAGMNPDEVRTLGEQLKRSCESLDSMARELNARLNDTSWVGQDANRFKHASWPQHRSRLSQIGSELAEFGRKAIESAQEQDRASGAGTDGEHPRWGILGDQPYVGMTIDGNNRVVPPIDFHDENWSDV